MSLDPNVNQPVYEYKAWPAWRYGPDGAAQVFGGPDEVPEGWTNIPPGTSTPDDEPVDDAPPVTFVEGDNDADDAATDADAEAAAIVAAAADQREPAEQTDEEKEEARKALIAKLVEDKGQKELVAELEAMRAIQPNIEFLNNWPKLKLATTIVDNGGPLED